MQLKFKIRGIHLIRSFKEHELIAITNKSGGDLCMDRKLSAEKIIKGTNYIKYKYKKL